ncbi:lipoprotein [Emticicia sp. W12TSBA100-4]|uniref:lipoprotein n=1 Tax=Emticicia sp. W12TSBA100-4 TaxID=3160965 RepID=UPI003305D78F
MKKLILFLSAIVVLASCQKKEYASFQKSNTPTYAVAKKQVVAAQPTTEVAVVEEATSSIVAPTEATLSADNSIAVASLSTETTPAPAVAESQVMTFNEQAVNAEFEKLNKLEEFVAANEGVTIEDVQNTELTQDLKLDTNVTNAVAAGELPLGIPAFWWGCVLGLLGVLAVYLITDKDKEQTKKALYGCLAWTVLWVVYYVVVLAAF